VLVGPSFSRVEETPWDALKSSELRCPLRATIAWSWAGLPAGQRRHNGLLNPSLTCVSVLAPSISLGMFGLSPWEVATGRVCTTEVDWAHHRHLCRWCNCTCHLALATSTA